MKNENFVVIQGWMINELKLKGNELILFAIIYGFSQDEQSEYYGSQRYIAKALKVSLPTANKLINKLLLKKVIHKTSESHYKVLKKVKQGVKESLTLSVKESYTNKYNTNNKDNNNSELSSQIHKIFDLFYQSINPTINFGNKTTRQSCEFLIKKFGFEKTKNASNYAISIQGKDKYAPRITTPHQLKEKFSELQIHYKNNQPKDNLKDLCKE